MLVVPRSSPPAPTALARSLLALCLLAVSCAPLGGDLLVDTKVAAVSASGTAGPGNLDLLFMIDDSPEMAPMQQKLTAQLPTFLTALESLPGGLPNIHIAVVSSDLGAPSDSAAAIGCTTTGDQGIFQSQPRGCAEMVLPSATYIANVNGVANYTGNIADVLSCITPLGESGCGFEHQLGSIARALGADGAPAPSQNAGFLRPDAELAIIIFSHLDDCSAPRGTVLYSFNGGMANLSNALGPMTTFRCNRFGHLCIDPTGDPPKLAQPPLIPPADVQGPSSAPTLNLTSCESLETDALLTPVSTFVSDIKALKSDPENQIVVGAIVAPPTPYTVAWLPSGAELWPQIEHTCGSAGDVTPTGQVSTDGSFGDPSVRISQWVQGFGDNGVTTSICDGSYADAFSAIVNRIAAHLQTASVAPTTTGAGGSGTTDAGGTGTTDVGGLGFDGGGGTLATGADGSSSTGDGDASGTGTAGHSQRNGLSDGGCDVVAGRPNASGLVLLVAVLIVARRRRAPSR
jgi:hypothetical protein